MSVTLKGKQLEKKEFSSKLGPIQSSLIQRTDQPFTRTFSVFPRPRPVVNWERQVSKRIRDAPHNSRKRQGAQVCRGGGEESCGIYANGNVIQERDAEMLDMEAAWAVATGISGQALTNVESDRK